MTCTAIALGLVGIVACGAFLGWIEDQIADSDARMKRAAERWHGRQR